MKLQSTVRAVSWIRHRPSLHVHGVSAAVAQATNS